MNWIMLMVMREVEFCWSSLRLFFIHSMKNYIDYSEVSSLSSALRVNSSVTLLDLFWSFNLNYLFFYLWLNFFRAVLVIKEYLHYHQHFESIHQLLNWAWLCEIVLMFLFEYLFISFNVRLENQECLHYQNHWR